MEVRVAEAADAMAVEGLLAEVHAAFGEAAPPGHRVREQVAASLAGQTGLTFLLAIAATEPVGLVSLALCPTTRDASRFAYLDDLYVRPASRRQGVAARLLAAARAWAESQGAVEVRLAADASNDTLWRLYREAGYARQSVSWMVLPLPRDWSGRK